MFGNDGHNMLGFEDTWGNVEATDQVLRSSFSSFVSRACKELFDRFMISPSVQTATVGSRTAGWFVLKYLRSGFGTTSGSATPHYIFVFLSLYFFSLLLICLST